MLYDFNATTDTQVKRREDVVKLDGRKATYYRYQVSQPLRSAETVTPSKDKPDAALRSAISRIGSNKQPAIA